MLAGFKSVVLPDHNNWTNLPNFCQVTGPIALVLPTAGFPQQSTFTSFRLSRCSDCWLYWWYIVFDSWRLRLDLLDSSQSVIQEYLVDSSLNWNFVGLKFKLIESEVPWFDGCHVHAQFDARMIWCDQILSLTDCCGNSSVKRLYIYANSWSN